MVASRRELVSTVKSIPSSLDSARISSRTYVPVPVIALGIIVSVLKPTLRAAPGGSGLVGERRADPAGTWFNVRLLPPRLAEKPRSRCGTHRLRPQDDTRDLGRDARSSRCS